MATKILSVDDSKMVHMVIGRTLKAYNITHVTALNGQEGVSKAIEEKPDLIVLDITMPVMDGLETLTKLKEGEETRDIPVIMLSADGGQDSVNRAVEMGAAAFITKPFTADSLITALSERIALPQPA